MEPLTVPGNLDSLSTIARYTIAAANLANLDQKSAYTLRLAVDEIATNIIIHGYEESSLTGVLVLSTQLDNQALKLCIEDTAAPYDCTQKADPEQLEMPIEHRPIGGLGVYLATQGVDQFTYERVGARNRTCFIVNR
jgi:anti-sigma regulatory factor (Ser/Thr protein kinase)